MPEADEGSAEQGLIQQSLSSGKHRVSSLPYQILDHNIWPHSVCRNGIKAVAENKFTGSTQWSILLSSLKQSSRAVFCALQEHMWTSYLAGKREPALSAQPTTFHLFQPSL